MRKENRPVIVERQIESLELVYIVSCKINEIIIPGVSTLMTRYRFYRQHKRANYCIGSNYWRIACPLSFICAR